MRHRYECPVRWADMDALKHVNNVRFVDYLQEARVDLLRAIGVRWTKSAEGMVVVRTTIDYRRPLLFRARPVVVECWVSEVRGATFAISYELYDEDETGRTTYACATTVLAPFVFATQRPRRLTAAEREGLDAVLEAPDDAGSFRSPSAIQGGHPDTAGRYRLQVRFSDTDAYGHVNNVHYLEYFQEARIHWLSEFAARHPHAQRTSMVVGRIDVDYRGQIHHRSEPYDCWTWIESLGTKSMVLRSEISSAGVVFSRGRSYLVFWDAEANQSTQPTAEVRQALSELLTPSS